MADVDLSTATQDDETARVKVKPLEWHGPDINDEYYARSIIGNFNVGYRRKDGSRWCMGEYHPSLEQAKAAAQADYELRIRSTLDSPVDVYARARDLEAELERVKARLAEAERIVGAMDRAWQIGLDKIGSGTLGEIAAIASHHLPASVWIRARAFLTKEPSHAD